jgi:alkylation response protein AidB-like acyl-CoA dehydrogenase
MGLGITEEHVELGQAVRRFLAQRCPREVARAGVESPAEELPAYWKEVADLGWLSLHIPERFGGQGYGLAELAVVVEEFARAGAPGPLLPNVLASAAIAAWGHGELQSEALPAFSAGAVGAVGFPATTSLEAGEPDRDGAVIVWGTARPVLGAAVADWIILGAVRPGGSNDELWCVLRASEVEVNELASLDPIRRSASVVAKGVRVPTQRQLRVDRHRLEALIAALAAAEATGGASWCVDTATEHAKVRVQFGRPIGQFQGVKHRCADMLVALEQAQAVTWSAVQAIDEALRPNGDAADAADADDRGEPRQENGFRLPAAVSGALAPDAFCRVAKDCIQVLGGIGFTWEHDAHLYLRRAVTLRQLLGGTSRWRRRVATLAISGERHRMHLELPEGFEEFREQIRSEIGEVAALPDDEKRRALVDAGLFVPHWAPPWGRDAGPVEQLVIDDELKRARLRRAHLAVGAWAAPTIATHGTPEQQERWVRPTLLGEVNWCQLFSEPGAGSDLASLSTKATRTEGGWLLNGQKVWTSLAAQADWGICLARSNPNAVKHLGISYFVVDMRTPGIEIRPLRELTGQAMFNEVFLDDVFVPDDCVVGEVDGGWPLARTTLANERVAMGSGSSFGGGVEALLSLVSGGDTDPVVLDGIGALVAEAHSVALLGQRATVRAVTGRGPGPEASVRKLLSAEHDQRTQEFGLGLLAGEGVTLEGAAQQWAFGFLANRCLTIAGGTSEVQRNVIAERLLGLPRDPEPVQG